MTIEIIEGQVCQLKGSKFEPISVDEYWNYCDGKETSPEGLLLLGLARVGISVSYATSPVLRFHLRTEIGKKELPEDAHFPADHIVLDKFWIPFEKTSVSVITDFIESHNLRNGARLKTADLLALLNLKNNSNLEIDISDELLEIDLGEGFNTKLPEGLEIKPYPYQDLGIRWLTSMFDQGMGAMLCDEMGLGKTLQAIGLILHAKQSGKHKILLCTPSSLTLNWQREIRKFAPTLDVLPYFGNDRFVHPSKFSELTLVHTSYDVLIRDFRQLSMNNWDLVICDEAQLLKNPNSQRSNAINSIKSRIKVLLTGTPIENSLKDLWTLTNIVYPGLLGSKNYFYSQIDDNPIDAERVGAAAAPLMKRRLVKDVLKDLPPLIEIDEVIPVSSNFAQFYEALRNGSHPKTWNTIEIAKITTLRQFCCYPMLVVPEFPKEVDAKFERLHEILLEVHERREKILVFATFTESINLIKKFILPIEFELIHYMMKWF
jgi:SNF2 family DNA or RNA helicase